MRTAPCVKTCPSDRPGVTRAACRDVDNNNLMTFTSLKILSYDLVRSKVITKLLDSRSSASDHQHERARFLDDSECVMEDWHLMQAAAPHSGAIAPAALDPAAASHRGSLTGRLSQLIATHGASNSQSTQGHVHCSGA